MMEWEMTVKYVQFAVAINGLSASNDALELLRDRIREATKALLLGELRDSLNFRDEFDSDIEVEIEERAGQ
jgi:hypothetical protein